MPSVKRLHSESHDEGDSTIVGGHETARPRTLKPLAYSGTLDSFKHQDLTPVIGREFEGLQVTDLLKWGDEMIKDLAVTSSFTSTFNSCELGNLTESDSFTARGCLSSRSR